jgi:hypothetical protein
MADLGEESDAMRAVLRRNNDLLRGHSKAIGEEFRIKVSPNFDKP